MDLEFTTTSKSVESSGIKMLVYGEAGMGKTSLAATAPAPIILSAESGLLSLQKSNIERMYGVGTQGISYDIPVIKIKTVQHLEQALTLLQQPSCDQFQTVFLDSITEIAEVVLVNEKAGVKDPRMAYGALITTMTEVVKKYRDLPKKNVVMLAKSEYSKDEASGLSRYGPSMPGSKFGQALPYLFDEVFRLFTNKDASGNLVRCVQTQPDLQHTAKDRSGALAAVDHAHLGYLFQKISGAI